MTDNSNGFLQSTVAQLASLRNRQTRQLRTYGGHREHTMELLANAARQRSSSEPISLSVMGAGNCLDLDLSALLELYETIQLIDLDHDAVESGVAAQVHCDPRLEAGRGSIEIIAPSDLAAPLASLTEGSFTGEAGVSDVCNALSARFDMAPAAPADVVASTCLLSQINDGMAQLATAQHPEFVSLLQALRRGHLRRMLQLLKPGGSGIFISDLVSSETVPELQEVTNADLPRVLASCLKRGNFFSGLNPGVLLQDLQTCDDLAAELTDVQIKPPWRWQMGSRIYAVYAVTFVRKG